MFDSDSSSKTTDDALLHVVKFRFGGPAELQAEWSDWLDNVHVPAVLAVPGVRSFTRYGRLGADRDFLTVWLIDGPHVFDHPAYLESRGWGPWETHMDQWTISLLEHARAPRRFGSAREEDSPL